ncbi:hypothetical protein FXN65_11580 [Metapseudomonas lalkuanensis]|uniref:Uncharacterized protein n=1 Tax=Metapseudomonas lalkuanensis TaxID=2604832 RepID=A0A5J6QJJ1_9GAMM|nr:hypothetical protein [Pseudomonas lalkuanensis]QEY62684.1 hypothetical protein FXN65_11580 [Pseudomonas lalkuanensis]UCO96088.1 hypothetical protein LF844_15475 [Pseudomonas lalkuanensis]
MTEEDESNRHLNEVRQSPVFRWAQGLQWFAGVMFLLAIGLALFTEVTSAPGGVPLIAAFGALGLLSLVSARFILTLYPMSPDEKARKGQTRS